MDNNNFNNYNQPNQNQYNNQGYQQNGTELEPSFTLGNWLLIMLLVSIPCVNIIVLLIWSFGHNVSTTKKNYSRAMLIFMVVGLIIGIIFSSIFATIFSTLGSEYYYQIPLQKVLITYFLNFNAQIKIELCEILKTSLFYSLRNICEIPCQRADNLNTYSKRTCINLLDHVRTNCSIVTYLLIHVLL